MTQIHSSWIAGHSALLSSNLPSSPGGLAPLQHTKFIQSISGTRATYKLWKSVQGRRPELYWFHFAIPTPTIVRKTDRTSNRIQIDSILLKFSSRDWYSEPPSAPNSEDYQSRTWIDTISVYDAAEVAAIHTERPDLSGDHHLNDGSALQFAISEKPRVNWCISIKIGVHVSFGRALPRTEDAEYGEITFGAVGVNFIDQLSTVQTEPGAVPIRL